ncbi:cytokine receptor-like [Penaeus indicus]|uniref:cytokine receptor-like n=1 Tax=Penaeus indicus TaxID=29960 RepID=UPI00300C9691
MGRSQWPLLLVLTACGVGGADRETRWVKVTPDRVRGHPDEHQLASSAMQLRADGNTPVLECPASSVRHAVLDKDSEEACKLRGGLNPKCPDLSGLIVFLNETQTKQSFTVLDDGKIDVYLKESRLGDFKLMYKCSSSNESVYTLKQIAVGNPPSDVENLTCISANWEYLNCSWTQPFNPAQDNDYGAFLYNRTWHCNNGDDQCVATTDNGYRPEDPYPPLIFMTENVLGAANFPHIIDNWAAMLPKPAEDLAAEEKSPMKISVTWTSPPPLMDFPPGLFYRLDISGLNPSFSTVPIVEKYSNSSTWEVETRIPYAWLTYAIKLRLRSGRRNATTDDHWDDGWSSGAVIGNVEVKPTAPWAAPEVGIGTFRVNRSEDLTRMDLTVMWRPLPRLLHNGPGLRYVVMCSNYSEIVNTTEPVATFSDLPTSSYRVTIQPENTEGKSNETSQIIISEDFPPVPALSVVVFHRTTGQYELRWDGENDYTYTVYVCINDSFNEDCKGFLYWLNVGNASAVNVTLQDLNITQRASKPRFALSAENAARGSSGMAWDRCSHPQDYDSNPKPPIIEITETDESIILNWKLSCINRTGVVEKAEASWGPTQHNCNSHISSETQIPKHDLKYNTNYTICLRLLYRSGYSDWSTKTYSMKKGLLEKM